MLLPSDEKNRSDYMNRYSKYSVFKAIKNKKILTVTIGQDHNLNLKKIEFVRQETRRINYAYLDNNVIKVHFENEATYGELVSILNNLREDVIKRYALLDDDLYIFGEQLPSDK